MVLFEQMIWVDFAIIGLIAIYSMMGLVRGSSKEMSALLSCSLAIGAGWGLALEFSEYLKPAIESPSWRIAAAFACLVMLVRTFTSFLFFLMSEKIKKIKPSFLDHLLNHISGMLAGAIRGTVNTATLVLLSGLTNLSKEPWWYESKLIPPFQSSAVWVRPASYLADRR